MKGKLSSKDSTSRLFNRYAWLVDLIHRAGRITFDEINQEWKRSCHNDSGEDLPMRTFQNHKAAIEQMFKINIGCDLRGGYAYYIENDDDPDRNGMKSWLLNTLAVNNLISESHKLKHRIQFEYIPSGRKYLATIVEAMRDNKVIDITYHPYWNDPFSTTLQPYFVKVFKQRWYVIGYNPYIEQIRIYALDRIEEMSVTDERFIMPADFDPEDYFRNCYGIEYGGNPQRIILKISEYQSNFIRALPLHHSQCEEESTDDYSLFSYFMCPHTYDFKQTILSLMSDVEVLEPASLRDEISAVIKETYSKYRK